MKTLFALFVFATSLVFAQEHPETSAPIYANLNIKGITRNMTTVNPRFNLVESAYVQFNNKSLNLTLSRKMPGCPPNAFCAQVMPAPLVINLAIINVVKTQCSVKYIAVTAPNVKSTIHEKVTIEDFSNTKCLTMNLLYTPGTLTYKVTGISSLTKRQETASATFVVNQDGFIRAQN